MPVGSLERQSKPQRERARQLVTFDGNAAVQVPALAKVVGERPDSDPRIGVDAGYYSSGTGNIPSAVLRASFETAC